MPNIKDYAPLLTSHEQLLRLVKSKAIEGGALYLNITDLEVIIATTIKIAQQEVNPESLINAVLSLGDIRQREDVVAYIEDLDFETREELVRILLIIYRALGGETPVHG